MDDRKFEVCQTIGNNLGISAYEVEINLGRVIDSLLIQATKEIKIYGTNNIKTPIHISQVKIPSLNERIRMYVESDGKYEKH